MDKSHKEAEAIEAEGWRKRTERNEAEELRGITPSGLGRVEGTALMLF